MRIAAIFVEPLILRAQSARKIKGSTKMAKVLLSPFWLGHNQDGQGYIVHATTTAPFHTVQNALCQFIKTGLQMT